MVSAAELRQRLGPISIGLRRDVTVSRQLQSGRASYVVHDPLTFNNHLFSVEEYRVLTAMVVGRSLEDTFQHLLQRGDLHEGDSEAYYRFVLNLHHMNLLQLPISDPDKLFERYQKRQTMKRKALLSALMYFKLPLWDPDRFLDKTQRFVSILFSKAGIALWAGLMIFTLWTCWGHFGELLGDSAALLEWSNVPILYVALVVLKGIHEFGHAYVCKRLGGAVPEMGVCFIITTPCAYVDASSSWKFRSRWDRIAVAMGGMYVESIVAALAALVWLGTPPGLAHDIALNVVALAGVVTVLFNINPLMRFDGYYAFADLTSAPNLRERSGQYIKEWASRIFLGVPRPARHFSAPYRLLYGTYGIGSFLYRLFLAFSITYLMLVRWPLVGAVLGVAFGVVLIVKPVLRLFLYLLRSEETQPMRGRAVTVALVGMILVPAVVLEMPISRAVVVPGLLEAEHVQVLRAPHDAEIKQIEARYGQMVQQGDVVATLDHPHLRTQHEIDRHRLHTEQVKLEVVEAVDRVEADRAAARVTFLRSAWRDSERRLRSMQVRAPVRSVVATPHAMDRTGVFVRQGEPFLELHAGRHLVRAVLAEAELSRLAIEVGSRAEIRWAAAPRQPVAARVHEIAPVASRQGMPESLTMVGGGDVYVKHGDEGDLTAAEPYVHVLLEPETVPCEFTSGLTARVRMAARSESLGGWIWKKVARFYQAWKTT